MNYAKQILWLAAGLLVLFAVLDFFSLTAWLVFPYSSATKKNKALTTAIGDTPAVNAE